MAQVGRPRLPTGPKTIDVVGLPINSPTGKISMPVQVVNEDIIIEDNEKGSEKKIVDEKKPADGEVNKKLEEIEIKPRPSIPLPSAQTIQSDNREKAYEWMQTLLPEHWVQLTWYAYRAYPRIIRPEQEKNIDVGQHPFDDKWIYENHGSGDYMFMFNRAGAARGAKTLLTLYVKLNHPDYPPKVKMDELDVHYKGNRTYVDKMVAEGKLTTDLRPMNSPQALGNDAVVGLLGKMIDRLDRSQLNNLKDPKDNAINTAIEIMAKGNQAATQMMLDQMKQEDPEKLLKLVAAIGNLIPKPVEHRDESGSQLMKFLEIMEKKDATIMGLMTKFIDKASQPITPAATDDGFDKSLNRFTKLAEIVGLGEGGGRKSTLEVALQYGTPILERALGIVQNLLALKAQNSPKIDPTTGKEVPQSVNQPGTSGLPVAIAQAPITPEGETQTNNKTNVEDAMKSNSTAQQVAIQQGLKQIGPRIIDALNRGVTGDQFAESIDGFMGPMVYNQLASLGESKILEILKSDQQLWSQLANIEGVLKNFIKGFIAYGSPEGEDEIIEESGGGMVEEVGKKVS